MDTATCQRLDIGTATEASFKKKGKDAVNVHPCELPVSLSSFQRKKIPHALGGSLDSYVAPPTAGQNIQPHAPPPTQALRCVSLVKMIHDQKEKDNFHLSFCPLSFPWSFPRVPLCGQPRTSNYSSRRPSEFGIHGLWRHGTNPGS